MQHPSAIQLLMDSLRYWVTEMHVDGFRFDLAAALARELKEVDQLGAFFDTIYQDPTLAPVRLIAELAQTLTDLIGPGAFIRRGDDKHEVASFKAAMTWLFEQAKKGQTIQRYKGLGEMNADQLWDTTINPETRRVLQVRIEDAVAADDIFTTLMGDAVEPRREFIENNALNVSNLDI